MYFLVRSLSYILAFLVSVMQNDYLCGKTMQRYAKDERRIKKLLLEDLPLSR